MRCAIEEINEKVEEGDDRIAQEAKKMRTLL
jgi:hypothetical protein